MARPPSGARPGDIELIEASRGTLDGGVVNEVEGLVEKRLLGDIPPHDNDILIGELFDELAEILPREKEG